LDSLCLNIKDHMSIFLSKFLPLFVYPVGLACLLLLLALLVWKKPRLAKALIIITLSILFIAGNRYVASSVVRSLEWQYLPTELSDPVDAIVILGGGTEPAISPRPSIEVNAAGDRVIYGAMLARQFPGAKVIVSGGDIEFLDTASSSPAQDMAGLLEFMGVAKERILIQGNSQNTFEDAQFTCKMITENGFEDTLLVTSATHMPRSMAVFTAAGCQVTAAPTDFTITDAAWQRLWQPNVEEFIINLIPSYTNISSLTKSLKEYMGMFYYKLQGIY
jgi:uncharacterized SAM-binding protein YcdF (DUF218 family)